MRTIDLVSIRKWLFLGSGLSALTAIVLLLIPPSLRPGIEFTSGTTMELRFQQGVAQSALRDEFTALDHPEARIQSTGASDFLIRTRTLQAPPGSFSVVEPTVTATSTVSASDTTTSTVVIGKSGATGDVTLSAVVGGDACTLGIDAGSLPAGTVAKVIERHDECPDGGTYRVQSGTTTGYIAAANTHDLKLAATATPTAGATPAATAAATAVPTPVATPAPTEPGEFGQIETALRQKFGNFDVLEYSTIAPIVSKAAVKNATLAVVIAAFFIMGYIAFAFSSVPRPGRYAACAIIATMHDVIIVLGAFSLFGKVFGVEVDSMFITGLLTIIGFSVHDTIVVFDRIRENVRMAPAAPLEENVNAALVQTLSRSLNTSTTVLLTILALLLLGGVTIQSLLLVLLVGVISGTYSSVGVAAQLLVSWENGDFGRIRDRLLGSRRRSAPVA